MDLRRREKNHEQSWVVFISNADLSHENEFWAELRDVHSFQWAGRNFFQRNSLYLLSEFYCSSNWLFQLTVWTCLLAQGVNFLSFRMPRVSYFISERVSQVLDELLLWFLLQSVVRTYVGQMLSVLMWRLLSIVVGLCDTAERRDCGKYFIIVEGVSHCL